MFQKLTWAQTDLNLKMWIKPSGVYPTRFNCSWAQLTRAKLKRMKLKKEKLCPVGKGGGDKGENMNWAKHCKTLQAYLSQAFKLKVTPRIDINGGFKIVRPNQKCWADETSFKTLSVSVTRLHIDATAWAILLNWILRMNLHIAKKWYSLSLKQSQ